MKLKSSRPDVFLRPPVSRFRALDFLKIEAVLDETASIKDELKVAVDAAVKARERANSK
jgi:NTE family protein